MKRIFPLALTLLIFSSCHFKIKHTKEEALEQNDKVITTLNPYYDAEDKFEGALADDESDIKAAYAEFKTAIDKVISELEAIPAFDEEDALKKATVDYVKSMKRTVETEFSKLVEIKQNPDYRNFESQNSIDLIDKYSLVYDEAEKQLKEAGDLFDKKQDAFAASYQFSIAR